MPRLTDERLAELRRIAEAATPGPWRITGANVFRVVAPETQNQWDPYYRWAVIADADPHSVDGEQAAANAHHISTFDPTTALVLLDEIERLRLEISDQQTTLENLRLALVAEGHEPGCPVVWGHSADCVPGTCIETRTYRATYGEKGGGGE